MGRAFKSALPDARMDVTRTVQAGDEVYVTGRFRGTHSGDLVTPGGTLPASGKALDLPFVDYWRVEDGKIVAHEATFDQMAMLSQLGAGPAQ
jgi:predicted ester cyclase